ncbi:hypothetical protein Sa4125_39760 [Aureimonas sp. SA4125]|nr:hypothetical protein Sa4125_39760 [Aureimonas sp. SA4125]
MVDAAFGRFDLGRAEDYRHFLLAQARVLLPLEARLATALHLPFRPRGHLLASDLASLDAVVPEPLTVEGLDGEEALLGALYVLEGSRLGGGMLARRVGPDLPRAFLGATHLRGEWRTLLAALDAAGETEAAQAAMVSGARFVFNLYAEAAGRPLAIA